MSASRQLHWRAGQSGLVVAGYVQEMHFAGHALRTVSMRASRLWLAAVCALGGMLA